jgi:hypothetical protein
MVGGGEVSPMLGPIDLIESLWKKLLSKVTKQWIERCLPAPSVKVSHGQINNAHVTRNINGLNRYPRGQ